MSQITSSTPATDAQDRSSTPRPRYGFASPLVPEGEWHGISERFVVVRRINEAIANVIVWALVCAGAYFVKPLPWLFWVALASGVAWTTWRIWRVRRWVRRWGWTERDGDLCIRRGLWFKELTVVPYGRMQLVEVSSGPLLRWQRLASVQLVTAALQSNARLPGLDHADATALRDRLIDRADAVGSGL